MRNIYLVFFFISYGVLFGQNSFTPAGSFEIIENSLPDKKQFYRESISKANLELYRLKEKRDTLEFRNGFRLVLYSAKELFLQGVSINISDYKESRNINVPLPIFVVFENGWLGAEVAASGKTNSK